MPPADDADRPPLLDYGRPASPGVPSAAVQVLLGTVAWFGAAGTFVAVAYAVDPADPGAAVGAGCMWTLAVLAGAAWGRVVFGWRWFVPGVVGGLLMTCLVTGWLIA